VCAPAPPPQDLLPILEGSVVPTKYGNVSTDHVLFIASGAFHSSKPSDMLAELQVRRGSAARTLHRTPDNTQAHTGTHRHTHACGMCAEGLRVLSPRPLSSRTAAGCRRAAPHQRRRRAACRCVWSWLGSPPTTFTAS
jgi:hypothetical protein